MRNLFPGYYRPTKAEFDQLWKDCWFAFDANVLLNVYRYTAASRDRLFEIWTRLQDRIWIPHQVGLEYHRNRLRVISEQFSEIKAIGSQIDDVQKVVDTLNKKRQHSVVDHKELADVLAKAIKKSRTLLNKYHREYQDYTHDDPWLDKITMLFEGRVGPEFTADKLDELRKTGDERFNREVPPGFLDRKNKHEDPYGDFILWSQLLEHGRMTKRPIVFVTDDNKEDWWWKHEGKTLGPRQELVAEMLSEAGIRFYLYSGSQFLDHAGRFLALSSEPEIVEEAQEVSQQSEDDHYIQAYIEYMRARDAGEQASGATPASVWHGQFLVAERLAGPGGLNRFAGNMDVMWNLVKQQLQSSSQITRVSDETIQAVIAAHEAGLGINVEKLLRRDAAVAQSLAGQIPDQAFRLARGAITPDVMEAFKLPDAISGRTGIEEAMRELAFTYRALRGSVLDQSVLDPTAGFRARMQQQDAALRGMINPGYAAIAYAEVKDRDSEEQDESQETESGSVESDS